MSRDIDQGIPDQAKEKVARKIQDLDKSLKQEREKVAQLEDKLGQHKREKTAEDIALMLAASGSIDYDSVVDERDKLAASDENLQQMKTSMKNYGPGKTNHSTVEAPETDSPIGSKKTGGKLFPNRDGEELPLDIKEAEQNIQRILNG